MNSVIDISTAEDAKKRLLEIVQLYPDKRSAIMPALYVAQEVFGWVSDDAVKWVAKQINVPFVEVLEVATFYSMFFRFKRGKYHIQMCRTLSCDLRNGHELYSYVRERLKVNSNEVTSDGIWSYQEVACLGSCGTGPALQINDVLFEFMNVEKLKSLMDRIENETPDLSYSVISGELGKGLSDCPRSQIWSCRIVERS